VRLSRPLVGVVAPAPAHDVRTLGELGLGTCHLDRVQLERDERPRRSPRWRSTRSPSSRCSPRSSSAGRTGPAPGPSPVLSTAMSPSRREARRRSSRTAARRRWTAGTRAARRNRGNPAPAATGREVRAPKNWSTRAIPPTCAVVVMTSPTARTAASGTRGRGQTAHARGSSAVAG
jgi:hypothetical protein